MVFLCRNILLSTFLCLLGCFPSAISAQNQPDTLARHSFRELDDLIRENRRDSLKVRHYVNYALDKARNESNYDELVYHFRNYVFYQKEEDRLRFIDSALYYAYKSQDKTLIAGAYLGKGTVYHNIKNYQKTLDNYLKANAHITQTDDVYSKYRIKHHIAVLKNYLGYYEEAAALFKECIDYFGQDEKSHNMQRGYVSSLQGLAWSYTKTNRIAESSELLATALRSAERAKFSELDTHYPVFRQGINDYFLGKYDSALYKIEQKMPFLLENEDFAWASVGQFYIGKSYWDRGDRERAIGYFKKIDEVFESKNYTHPDLRNAYELLINYYKSQGDKDKQIRYIEQLVRVDSFYIQNYKHLISSIYNEYTTGDLLLAKSELETALYLQKNKNVLIVIVGAFILLLISGIMYYRQRKSKRIAQELIQKIKTLQDRPPSIEMERPLVEEVAKSPLQLKDEVAEQLLSKLNKFEQSQKFLQPNLTMDKLANSLGTNRTYLSSLINTYKKQSFSEYLNSLRIEYVVNEMVNHPDSVFFKYSFESLATHLGYSNATVFSRAFQERTGIKPSVFVKELLRDKVVVS